ncbi:MAG: hypothetical protein K9I82_11420 [Chitinophagaceae bacterium]|nr:hypothetical protein [Chitinophagaceae bacterium]
MANLKEKTPIFSRLRNRYRLVIMNDETYEEVAAFKLDKLSVYVTLCTIFIILVSLTVALIVFTPMRYYIPGYGSQTDRRQLMAMKQRSDSIEKKLKYSEKYWNDVKMVLNGASTDNLDTMLLKDIKLEQITD